MNKKKRLFHFPKYLVPGLLLILVSCQTTRSQEQEDYRSPDQNCEWCGADDAPPFNTLSWQTVIPPEEEPGEKLIISGTIYQPDGETPASDILVYVYHTNQEGIYPTRGNETDNARRHGYLRGWMLTNDNGQYRFETIKPMPYPSRSEPAHIHYTLTGSGFTEYWINSVLFEGDPLIEEEEYKQGERSGGAPRILNLKKKEGIWYGERDIVLSPELMK